MPARHSPPGPTQGAVARVYDEPAGSGHRGLVDRLWRAIAKERLAADEWAKEVAPSTELRRWYGHDPARFVEFARRYRAELSRLPAARVAARLANLTRERPLVVLSATRDVERSGARVLAEHLATLEAT